MSRVSSHGCPLAAQSTIGGGSVQREWDVCVSGGLSENKHGLYRMSARLLSTPDGVAMGHFARNETPA